MQEYLDVLRDVMENGTDKPNRTGVDTRAVFARMMRFNVTDGFPIVTTKRMAVKSMVAELLGHIRGFDSAAQYREIGSKVWDANANENPHWVNNLNRKGEDDLGRIYGVQWRRWRRADGEEVDQLQNVINGIKNNPYSRYHLVTAWNPGELDEMALPPCPMTFQFFVANGELSLLLYQRSCDMFLGVPFNISQYCILLHMVAQLTGYKPKEFIHILADAHIYENHFDAVHTQLERSPRSLPTLWLNPDIQSINDFGMDDVRIDGYDPDSKISAPMAV